MLEGLKRVPELAAGFALWHLESTGNFWLFNVDSGEAYDLNLVSYLILSNCDGRRNLGDILKTLGGRFPGVTQEELERDLLEFVGLSAKMGLLQLEPAVIQCARTSGGESR